jgi:uncharacterized hydrophobic protein (TIGR00271 family)
MPPFLKPVENSDLEALQKRMDSLSTLSADFLVLLSGATLIATLGLFQNSPAVIIGAMIIAPLMRPMVGLSLGTLTGDSRLIIRAAITLSVGTLLAMGIAASMAMLFRSLELTPEILSRTNPTLLDLGVAVFAGAIGAYCQADAKLSDSLAGVAISVALVPPLSVVGIGICFGSPSVFTGALLLYATNLIGITVAGAVVFLLKGFIPLHQAKRGLVISAIVSILLIVPLGFSMRELVLQNLISIKTKTILKEKTHTFRGTQLGDVKVERFKEPMIVVATVFSPERPITSNQVRLVQDFLSAELNFPVEFKLRLIPVTTITANDEPVTPSRELLDTPPQPAQEHNSVETGTGKGGEQSQVTDPKPEESNDSKQAEKVEQSQYTEKSDTMPVPTNNSPVMPEPPKPESDIKN